MTLALKKSTVKADVTVPDYLLPIVDRLKSLDDKAVIAELSKGFSTTIEGLRLVAGCILVLESRGVDLESIEIGNSYILADYRKMAYGTLLPEVVFAFMGRRNILNAVSRLPVPDQCKLAANRCVDLACIEDEKPASRKADAATLTPSQVSQVFSENGIRSIEAQHGWLKQHVRADRPEIAEEKAWEYNQALKKLVVYKPTSISRDDLLSIMQIALGKSKK